MNILLTSVGRRTYMVSYFINALKGIGQVHAGNNIESYPLQMADKGVITPLIYDEKYIDFLIAYCTENSINAIIPLLDIDLPILAKNRSKFEMNGIRVIVSTYETTVLCNDKWLTYEFLKANGFNTPKTYLSIDEIKNALKEKTVCFPLIIKPRWGMGAIGIFQADNLHELVFFYMQSKKCIRESYLKYECSQDPDRSVIIQEKLSGGEYGLDVFNDLNGNYLTCVPKRKIGIRAGETEIAETIDDPELFALGKKLSRTLKHVADLDVDCFNVDGHYYVLELNCRFGGQYPFCHLAGVDFPKALVNMLSGKPVAQEMLRAKQGTIGIKDINPVIMQ